MATKIFWVIKVVSFCWMPYLERKPKQLCLLIVHVLCICGHLLPEYVIINWEFIYVKDQLSLKKLNIGEGLGMILYLLKMFEIKVGFKQYIDHSSLIQSIRIRDLAFNLWFYINVDALCYISLHFISFVFSSVDSDVNKRFRIPPAA